MTQSSFQSLLGDSLGYSDLDSSLECLGMGKFQYFLLILCGLNFMSDALEVNLLSYLSACTSDTWSLSSSEQASLSGVVFIGIMVGSIYWGSFADIYGRRKTFIYSSCLILLGGVVTTFVTNFLSLIFIRFLVGVGIGGASVPFDLLAEFLPSRERGIYLVFIEFFWTIGSMYVNGLAWAILPSSIVTQQPSLNNIFSKHGGWRLLSLFTVIPAFFAFFIGYIYLPESPMWLLSKGKREEAEKIIIDAANFNGESSWIKLRDLGIKVLKSPNSSCPSSFSTPTSSPVLNQMHSENSSHISLTSIQSDSQSTLTLSSPLSHYHASSTKLPFKLYLNEEVEEHSFKQYLSLVTDSEMRKISLPLWSVWFFFGLTYYGVILLTGRIYSNDDSDDENDDAKACDFDYPSMFISSVSEVLGVILCIYAMDRVGRIKTQMIFYFIAGIGAFFMTCLGMFSYFQNKGSLFILLVSILARMAAMGSSSATWVSTPEVFPTNLRTVGHSISASLSKIGAILSPYIVISPLPLLAVGIILGIGNFIAVFSTYLLPETSGKALGKVQEKVKKLNEQSKLVNRDYLKNNFIETYLSPRSSDDIESLHNSLIRNDSY